MDQFRLLKLMEECGEVVQIGSKFVAYGPESVNPEKPDKNNTELLIEEIGDLLYQLKLCDLECDPTLMLKIHKRAEEKLNSAVAKRYNKVTM